VPGHRRTLSGCAWLHSNVAEVGGVMEDVYSFSLKDTALRQRIRREMASDQEVFHASNVNTRVK